MKKFLLAVVLVVATAQIADAGPIRRFFQNRRGATTGGCSSCGGQSQATNYQSVQMQVPCPTCPSGFRTVIVNQPVQSAQPPVAMPNDFIIR